MDAVRPSAKTATIQSAIKLSQGNPGHGALSDGTVRSVVGESSFNLKTQTFSDLDPVYFPWPSCDLEMNKLCRRCRKNILLQLQRRTRLKQPRFARAISHACVAVNSPNSASKPFVTRLSAFCLTGGSYYTSFARNDQMHA